MDIKKRNIRNIDSIKDLVNGEEIGSSDERPREKRKRPRLLYKISLLILIGIVLVVIYKFTCTTDLFHSTGNMVSDVIEGHDGIVTTISEASLEEVFEIGELSTADYTYNAVAYAYEDDGITPKYYVAYEGMVTAGIDFSKIIIDVNEESKLITLKIPECEIQDTTVDFGTMEYIFKKDKYNTETVSQEAYKLCEADLAERTNTEEDLLSLAKENATAAVEALVNPWVKQIDTDYTVNIQ